MTANDTNALKCLCAYALFRPDTGDVFYIGIGGITRPQSHTKNRQYGRSYKDNIICYYLDTKNYEEIPYVIFREDLTKAEARAIEISFIAAIGRHPNGPLANVTAGGEGLKDPTISFRLNHSKLLKNVLNDPIIKEKMSYKAKIRDRTGEWEEKRKLRMSDEDVRDKLKISAKRRVRNSIVEAQRIAAVKAARTRMKLSGELKGKPSPWKGRTPTAESREKMRKAKIGKIPWNKGLKTGMMMIATEQSVT